MLFRVVKRLRRIRLFRMYRRFRQFRRFRKTYSEPTNILFVIFPSAERFGGGNPGGRTEISFE